MKTSFLSISQQPLARRHFLIRSAQAVATLAIAGDLTASPHHVSKSFSSATYDPVTLPPLDAKTEQEKGPLPNPLPPDKRIGYAVVGLGHLALEEVLPAFGLCKKSKLVALVSGDKNKALTVAQQYGVPEKNIYNYQNYDSIKDNPEVDVIYIILPNSLHAEYTIRGAKAGKHILCEKPMANTAAECEQMIRACRDANKQLMIAYRIQYEPNNAEIKKMVREQTYGKVKTITAMNSQNIGDPSQWRLNKKLAGGGSLPDVGIYCLNTIRYLTGKEPVEVYAKVHSTPADPRFTQVEETVEFQLTFSDGLQAICGCSYGQHQSRNYRVYAERAYFGMDPAFSYKGLQMHRSFADGEKEIYETPRLAEKNHFALEMDHLSDCILSGKKNYTPGEEGLQDMKIIEAIYTSAAQHKPVALPLIPGTDVFRGREPSE